MNYRPELENHIRDKVIKVVLNLSNFATKKLNDAAGVDTFNLAAKSD